MADVGHLVGDDQMVLGVDRGLDVVADDPRPLAAGGHRARVRVAQRDLPVRRGLHHRLHRLQVRHLLA
jgi:hypothetical protein